MSALTGPYFIAVLLLGLAGAPKVVRPDDTAGALASVGWPSARWLVRLGGAVEVGIAVAALAGLPAAPWLIAACYAGFVIFVAVALRYGGLVASCGCFGRPDTPPTRTHLAFVAACSVSAGLVALSGAVGSLLTALRAQPAAGVPFLLALATGTCLGLLLLERLPQLSMRARA